MSSNVFNNRYNFDEQFIDDESGDDEPLDGEECPENEQDTEFISCPSCGKEIYDDAEICPCCENYVVKEDEQSSFPFWVVCTAIVLLGMIIFGFAGVLPIKQFFFPFWL